MIFMHGHYPSYKRHTMRNYGHRISKYAELLPSNFGDSVRISPVHCLHHDIELDGISFINKKQRRLLPDFCRIADETMLHRVAFD